MKRLVELTKVQRIYLHELVSIDLEVNASVPIYDEERDETKSRGGNSFRIDLLSFLSTDFNEEESKKIGERYWTGGRLGKIKNEFK